VCHNSRAIVDRTVGTYERGGLRRGWEKSCYWKWKDTGWDFYLTWEDFHSLSHWEFDTTLLQVLEKYQWALRGKIQKPMLRNVWSLTNYFIVSGLFLLCCINWNQFSTHCLLREGFTGTRWGLDVSWRVQRKQVVWGWKGEDWGLETHPCGQAGDGEAVVG